MLVNFWLLFFFVSGSTRLSFHCRWLGPRSTRCAFGFMSVSVWYVFRCSFFMCVAAWLLVFVSFVRFFKITAPDYVDTREPIRILAMILDVPSPKPKTRKQQLIMNKTEQNDAFDVNNFFFFASLLVDSMYCFVRFPKKNQWADLVMVLRASAIESGHRFAYWYLNFYEFSIRNQTRFVYLYLVVCLLVSIWPYLIRNSISIAKKKAKKR